MYYIVQDLAQAHASGATKVGLKQPPQIGGDWLFDLLDPNEAVLQSDCTAPAGADVDTLSEVAGSPVGATFIRDVNAHLFPA